MKTLLPVKFVKLLTRNALIFQDPERINFELGFFRDAVSAAPDAPEAKTLKVVDQWLDESEPPSEDFSRTTIIFHVARCGSTLLCQNLKATGQYLVLGEPQFVHALMQGEGKNSATIFAKIVSEWQSFAQKQGKRLVIKASSGASAAQQFLLSALPGVKVLLLVREPIASLESMTRKPAKFILKELDELPCALQAHQCFRDLDFSQISSRAAVHYSMCIEHMTSIRHDYRIVNYQSLSSSFQAIHDYCTGSRNGGFTPSWNSNVYAKNSESRKNKPYVPIVQQDLDDFAHLHAEAVMAADLFYQKMDRHAKEQLV